MAFWNGTQWVPDQPTHKPQPRRRHRLWGAAAEAGLITILISGLIAGTALAGKPASRGGGGHSSATLTFEVAAVTVGNEYAVVGTGYRADTWVTVGARYSDTTWWASGVTDGTGSFRFMLTASSPGQVLHEAYEQTRSGVRWKAGATLTVNP